MAIADTIIEMPTVDSVSTVPFCFYDSTTFQCEVLEEPEEESLFCLDSVFSAIPTVEPVMRESLFVGHELPVKHHNVMSKNEFGVPSWTFGYLVALIAIIGWLFNIYKFQIVEFFQSLFNRRGLERFFRDHNLKQGVTILPMMLSYSAGLGLTAFSAMKFWGIDLLPFSDIFTVMVLFAGVSILLLIKNWVVKFIGDVFETEESVAAYISNNSMFQYVGGLLLTPFLMFSIYAQNTYLWLIFLAILVTLIFVLRVFRGLQIILTNSKSSRFYLFYYLCIFEFVPLLIVGKLLISY